MIKEKEVRKPTKKEQEFLIEELPKYFKKIKNVLKEYMDMNEGAYIFVAIWIIGTYLHKQFSSYPYLYFNAMKGSGKTRGLKIIANLSKNGSVAGSMTEAVLFRTASQRTLCIDELEGINKKGNENLKLLLNSAYKKGLSVERLNKKKTIDGEQQIVEAFEVYCPVAMANIWGLDNVLSDRCVPVILEKSAKKEITRLIENFENESDFKEIRGGLTRITENIGDNLNWFGWLFTDWNKYVKEEEFDNKYKELFEKIGREDIEGRDLELFFPLFIIADMCGKKVLDEVINISKTIVKERKEKDREENRDIQIYEFIAKLENTDFISIADLVKQFKEFGEYGDNDTWVNARFLGRGLRRLNLVIDDRRRRKREVRLNIDKAKEKLKILIDPNEKDFKEELKGVLG